MKALLLLATLALAAALPLGCTEDLGKRCQNDNDCDAPYRCLLVDESWL